MLGTGGVLASSVLATGGADGQVLQRTSTGQEWADSSGTITSVATGGGLSGGGTSGAITIRLDLISLPNLPTLNAFDRVIVLDQGDNNAAKDIGIDDFSNYVATRMRLDLVNLEGMIALSMITWYSPTHPLADSRGASRGAARSRA